MIKVAHFFAATGHKFAHGTCPTAKISPRGPRLQQELKLSADAANGPATRKRLRSRFEPGSENLRAEPRISRSRSSCVASGETSAAVQRVGAHLDTEGPRNAGQTPGSGRPRGGACVCVSAGIFCVLGNHSPHYPKHFKTVFTSHPADVIRAVPCGALTRKGRGPKISNR